MSEADTMSEMVRKVDYYYTAASNKPGEGAQLLDALRRAGVSLLAVHGFPSARKAQIDFVPIDAVAFLAAAKSAKIKLSKPKTTFLIQGDDRTGAMADVLGRLVAAKINITAVTGISAGMGRYGAILWVKPKDVTKAAAALGAS